MNTIHSTGGHISKILQNANKDCFITYMGQDKCEKAKVIEKTWSLGLRLWKKFTPCRGRIEMDYAKFDEKTMSSAQADR